MVINQSHPCQSGLMQELLKKIPDLRTLNTLHSEKLLAFKMTEQQQLQEQQSHHWTSEEEGKSPSGSWSSSSDVAMEEVKSPLGSVSSTESTCSGEVASLNEYQTQHHPAVGGPAASAPLLAATLAGCPHRSRTNSGSSGDEIKDVKPCQRAFRKLDSPSDSGIESGTERPERQNSAPTSVCSSPRSSVEEEHHHVEDMPVLKRVLQAPPLYDTNSLMDEAYKPHKKFRALRNKDSEPEQSEQSSLSSSHSTLARTLMEGPRMTPEQIQRTDIIHNYIMRGEPRYSSVITSTGGSGLYPSYLPSGGGPTSQPLNLSKKTPPPSPRPCLLEA